MCLSIFSALASALSTSSTQVSSKTATIAELPAAVAQYIKAHDGLLLANHGALTVGSDLYNAYYKMETVEHFAQISLVARTLGGERLLSRAKAEAAAQGRPHRLALAFPWTATDRSPR